jgi:hypothetical protein
MDDDEDVVCIESPVPSNARTPRPGARNGGAARVRLNGEGSKSASSPVRPGKFKKQRRAHREYVRPKEWKVVRRYATGGRAQLDTEDIDFDIYQMLENIEDYDSVAKIDLGETKLKIEDDCKLVFTVGRLEADEKTIEIFGELIFFSHSDHKCLETRSIDFFLIQSAINKFSFDL